MLFFILHNKYPGLYRSGTTDGYHIHDYGSWLGDSFFWKYI